MRSGESFCEEHDGTAAGVEVKVQLTEVRPGKSWNNTFIFIKIVMCFWQLSCSTNYVTTLFPLLLSLLQRPLITGMNQKQTNYIHITSGFYFRHKHTPGLSLSLSHTHTHTHTHTLLLLLDGWSLSWLLYEWSLLHEHMTVVYQGLIWRKYTQTFHSLSWVTAGCIGHNTLTHTHTHTHTDTHFNNDMMPTVYHTYTYE